MILDRRIGDIPVLRRYIGDTLVWEREAPPSLLWTSFVNFGAPGGSDLPNWNNVKPASLSDGGSFSGLSDINGVPRLDLDVTAGLADEIAPLPSEFSYLPNSPELYDRGWAFFGPGNMTFTFSGLDDSNYYKIVLYSASPTMTGISTPTYTINGVTKPMLQGYDTDQNIEFNSTFAGFNNISPVGGSIHLDVSIPVSIGVSFGCVVIAHDRPISLGSDYTIDAVSTEHPSDPPCAYYHSYRPGTENDELPLIISLPMGMTEGDGSLSQLDSIIGGNIMKAITTKTFNPSADVRVIAPQFYENVDNAHLLNDLITHIKSEYNVDSDKVYIMGASAGGENALYYAGYTGRGEPFHKIAAMMVANTPLTPGYVSFGEIAASEIPIWFFSATGDNVPWIQDIVDGVRNVDPDYPLRMSVFTGGDHWTPVHFIYGKRDDALPIEAGYDPYQNGEIYDWLLSH